MFDTEDIIQRAHLGDLDYVKHAFALTTNFWDILLRIVTTMVCKLTVLMCWTPGVFLTLFMLWLIKLCRFLCSGRRRLRA